MLPDKCPDLLFGHSYVQPIPTGFVSSGCHDRDQSTGWKPYQCPLHQGACHTISDAPFRGAEPIPFDFYLILLLN